MIKITPLLKQSSDASSNETPFELLESCHEKIIHFSSILLKLCTALKQQGWSEELVATAHNITHYFNIASPEHHFDEELHLFPAIIALNAKSEDQQSRDLILLINRMIKEHVESDALWEKINHLLNNKSEDFKQLETLSIEFEKTMCEHAAIENSIIFPFAKAHISAAEFKKMGIEIAARRGIPI